MGTVSLASLFASFRGRLLASGSYYRQEPAMAPRISRKVWSIEEIVFEQAFETDLSVQRDVESSSIG